MKKYEQLLAVFKLDGQLSPADEALLRQYFQPAKAAQNEIILKAGVPCGKIFFISKGLVQAYQEDKKGHLFTRRLATENQFLTNPVSFAEGGANTEVFECLEDTEYLYITHEALQQMLDSSPTLSARYQKILTAYAALNVQHLYAVTRPEMPDRIRYLNALYPKLVRHCKNAVLASYLNMASETYSRYKKGNLG
jgi:CRP-like cAMP-binding protein